jgi:hypothetical protein
VIRQLSDRQLQGIPPAREDALRLLEKNWSPDAHAAATHEAEDRAKAEAMLETYLENPRKKEKIHPCQKIDPGVS